LRERRENDLGRDAVKPLLLRLAGPAIVAQLVNALYNIVDRIYIGHIEGEGQLALTGVGVTFAVLMLISALASLVGVGGGSRAAIAMGEGNNDRAEKILGACTLLLAVLSIVVVAVFQWIKEPMLLAFGASENTIAYATGYLGIYLWGTASILLTLGLNTFIATQGFASMSMATTLIGAVLNIALDPVFIFVLKMGVRGAALATILSQTASAVWVLCFLTGKRTHLHLRRKNLRMDGKILGPVLAIGVSPFVMQSTESILNVAFNSSLLKYGGDLAVGAMTICSSVVQVMSMLLMGLAQGGQPIMGYNYGAGNSQRVKETFRFLLTLTVSLSTLFCVLVEMFPHLFVGLFTSQPALQQYATWAIRIYAAGMFMMGVQNGCQQSFVALGQAKISLCMALLRKCVLLIPLIYILPGIFANKVFAVFLAEPVSDILAASTTGTLFFTRLPRILEKRTRDLGEAPE